MGLIEVSVTEYDQLSTGWCGYQFSSHRIILANRKPSSSSAPTTITRNCALFSSWIRFIVYYYTEWGWGWGWWCLLINIDHNLLLLLWWMVVEVVVCPKGVMARWGSSGWCCRLRIFYSNSWSCLCWDNIFAFAPRTNERTNSGVAGIDELRIWWQPFDPWPPSSARNAILAVVFVAVALEITEWIII